MKKILCLLMAIVCASAMVFSLGSCSSLGGDDGDDITVSEKVTQEEFAAAFDFSKYDKLQLEVSTTFIEPDGNEEFRAKYKYENNVLCAEEYENSKWDEDTDTWQEEMAYFDFFKIVPADSLPDCSFDFYSFSYSEEDSCYVYTSNRSAHSCEVKLFFKDSKLIKIDSYGMHRDDDGDGENCQEMFSSFLFSYK